MRVLLLLLVLQKIENSAVKTTTGSTKGLYFCGASACGRTGSAISRLFLYSRVDMSFVERRHAGFARTQPGRSNHAYGILERV